VKKKRSRKSQGGKKKKEVRGRESYVALSAKGKNIWKGGLKGRKKEKFLTRAVNPNGNEKDHQKKFKRPVQAMFGPDQKGGKGN